MTTFLDRARKLFAAVDAADPNETILDTPWGAIGLIGSTRATTEALAAVLNDKYEMALAVEELERLRDQRVKDGKELERLRGLEEKSERIGFHHLEAHPECQVIRLRDSGAQTVQPREGERG